MDIKALKKDIEKALSESILLTDEMRLKIKTTAYHLQDEKALKHILSLLDKERDYIIDYLRQVIKIDTTGLTVRKLHDLMQKTYVKMIHSKEAGSAKADIKEAGNLLSQL